MPSGRTARTDRGPGLPQAALHRPQIARLGTAVAVLGALLSVPATASAHSDGKALPVITARIVESGPLEALVDVRLVDEDGGEPVREAEVRGTAKMTTPHTMFTYFGPLPEVAPGRYRARVKLPMTARWSVRIGVTGPEVVPRAATLTVKIAHSALDGSTAPATGAASTPTPASARGVPDEVLVGAVRYDITRREVRDMAVLWVHGLAATAWIVGLVLLVVAVTAGSGSLLPEQRAAVGRWYRKWGLPATWIAALLVVATGVYNALRVTPFGLAWRPGDLDRLDAVPYGLAYETLLLLKLALFGVMLVAGMRVITRARTSWGEPTASTDATTSAAWRRLGVAGAVFLLSAPLIVATAVALRYVHILSHVAEAAGS